MSRDRSPPSDRALPLTLGYWISSETRIGINPAFGNVSILPCSPLPAAPGGTVSVLRVDLHGLRARALHHHRRHLFRELYRPRYNFAEVPRH